MQKSWREEWYRVNPEGLVGRLRDLIQSRPEAARALAMRLEREGWGPWWELLEDLKAPRAFCPVCEGEGVVLTAPWPSWAPPDIRPEVDCPECGGEGLAPLHRTARVETFRSILYKSHEGGEHGS